MKSDGNIIFLFSIFLVFNKLIYAVNKHKRHQIFLLDTQIFDYLVNKAMSF